MTIAHSKIKTWLHITEAKLLADFHLQRMEWAIKTVNCLPRFWPLNNNLVVVTSALHTSRDYCSLLAFV